MEAMGLSSCPWGWGGGVASMGSGLGSCQLELVGMPGRLGPSVLLGASRWVLRVMEEEVEFPGLLGGAR